MADDAREGEGSTSRGADWEVVSLTASAYAAAPGPKVFDSSDEIRDYSFNGKDEDSSDAMFMFSHFVFPPAEHENLPVEHDFSEILGEVGSQGGKSSKDDLKSESDYDLHGIEFSDKGKVVSDDSVKSGESEELQGLILAGEEKVMYGSPEFRDFHPETDMRQSGLFDDSFVVPEPDDISHQNVDSPRGYANDSKTCEENKRDGPCLPWEAGWKKHATTLYTHVKETNKYWSVVVVAAVVGLVILGHRWHKDKLQLQQLKFKSSINNEGMNQMTGSISRFKDVLVGSHEQRSWIGGGATV